MRHNFFKKSQLKTLSGQHYTWSFNKKWRNLISIHLLYNLLKLKKESKLCPNFIHYPWKRNTMFWSWVISSEKSFYESSWVRLWAGHSAVFRRRLGLCLGLGLGLALVLVLGLGLGLGLPVFFFPKVKHFDSWLIHSLKLKLQSPFQQTRCRGDDFWMKSRPLANEFASQSVLSYSDLKVS